MKISLRTPEKSPLQGLAAVLGVRVENAEEGVLVLEQAHAEPVMGRLTWLVRPRGLISYDAASDTYRHHGATPTVAAVPRANVLLPSGASAESMLRASTLESGPLQLAVEVSAYLLPKDQVTARVYGCADIHDRVAVYSRLESLASLHEAEASIVRLSGLSRITQRVEVDLEVEPNPEATRLLDHAGTGAELLGRWPQLGGVWGALGEGRLHFLRGEELFSHAVTTLDPAAMRAMEGFEGETVRVIFAGAEARSLRDSGRVPLEGLDYAQQILAASDFWTLVEAAGEAGLCVTSGEHSLVAGMGLIVRSR